MAMISDSVRQQLTSGDLSLPEKKLYCHNINVDSWGMPIEVSCSESFFDDPEQDLGFLTQSDRIALYEIRNKMWPHGVRADRDGHLWLNLYPKESRDYYKSENIVPTKLNGKFEFTIRVDVLGSTNYLALNDYNLNGVIDGGDTLTVLVGNFPAYVLTGGLWYAANTPLAGGPAGEEGGPVKDQDRLWDLVPIVESAYQSALKFHGFLD